MGAELMRLNNDTPSGYDSEYSMKIDGEYFSRQSLETVEENAPDYPVERNDFMFPKREELIKMKNKGLLDIKMLADNNFIQTNGIVNKCLICKKIYMKSRDKIIHVFRKHLRSRKFCYLECSKCSYEKRKCKHFSVFHSIKKHYKKFHSINVKQNSQPKNNKIVINNMQAEDIRKSGISGYKEQFKENFNNHFFQYFLYILAVIGVFFLAVFFYKRYRKDKKVSRFMQQISRNQIPMLPIQSQTTQSNN